MATSTVLAKEEIFHIPLADIQLSKTNPRREMDEQALDELAADIANRGVQEPILVRPITGSEAKFEVVFGERRYKASQKAGNETIRAMKREISDEEAEDLQIMENLQREDLSFLLLQELTVPSLARSDRWSCLELQLVDDFLLHLVEIFASSRSLSVLFGVFCRDSDRRCRSFSLNRWRLRASLWDLQTMER